MAILRSGMAPKRLDDSVLELLGSGVVIYVATRDAENTPCLASAMGVHADPDGSTITLYLPAQSAAETVSNLQANGLFAVTFCRPSDDKTVQLKGVFQSVRNSDPADRALQENYRSALIEQFSIVGVPRSLAKRMHWWPSVAVILLVNEVYTQTPGPHAGRLWAGQA